MGAVNGLSFIFNQSLSESKLGMKVAVLGAGAWGTALAMQVSKRHQTVLWARKELHVSAMREARANHQYLGDFSFGDKLTIEDNLETTLQDADLVISVVPSSGFRDVLKAVKQINPHIPLIWASKGLEPATAKLAYEVAQEELGDGTTQPWGALSGPSFAIELVKNLPTAVTVATTSQTLAQNVATALHGGNFRVYTSDDVVGVCVGGALKNVMAIAAGISDGMQFGSNARAAMMTRGLAEMTRFGLALGGKRETFMGLAGAGDLILTCTGDYSRNREVGVRLARGQTLQDILNALGHVAEGVHTTREVANRALTLGVEMPITHEVSQVLSNACTPRDAVERLLGREQKSELT